MPNTPKRGFPQFVDGTTGWGAATDAFIAQADNAIFEAGTYNASTPYKTGDMVLHANGATYRALQPGTGNDPATTPSFWQVFTVTPALIGAVGTGDSRLSDARTPLAHAASHVGGDPIQNATDSVPGLMTAADHTSLTAHTTKLATLPSSVTGTAPVAVNGSGVVSIVTATDSIPGAMSAADHTQLTLDKNKGTNVFTPEMYKAGGDPDDTLSIQAAINAAGSAGGGIVRLSPGKTYTVSKGGGFKYLGVYPQVDYGVWVNYSNVHIQGYGATIVLAAVPTMQFGSFVVVLFGNGGGTIPIGSGSGNLGPFDETDGTLAHQGLWTYNTGIYGVTFDQRNLTDTQLDSMSQHIGGACVSFAHCDTFTCRDVVVYNGHGYDAPIFAMSGPKNGLIDGCKVYHSIRSAIRIDGGRDCTVSNCWVSGAGANGIQMQANLDNHLPNFRLSLVNNRIYGWAQNWLNNGVGVGGGALGISGVSDSIVTNNICVQTPVASGTGYTGMNVQSYSTSSWKASGSRNIVSGNRFYRNDNTIGTFLCLTLAGEDVNNFDAGTNDCADNLISGNYFSPNWTVALQLGQQATRTSIIGNHFEGTRSVLEAVATATGNYRAGNSYSANAANRAEEMTNSLPVTTIKGPLFVGSNNTLYDTTNNYGIMHGSATPEGAVTASIGSLYHQYGGAARSTVLWQKQTGGTNSNTGWTPIGSSIGNYSQLPTGVAAGQRFHATDFARDAVYDGANWGVDGEYAGTSAVSAGGTVATSTPTTVITASVPVTLSSSTPLQAGSYDGQRLLLINTSVNNVTIPTGGNVSIPSNLTLATNENVYFYWRGSTWYKANTNALPGNGTVYAHATNHLAGGGDAITWTTINASGLLSARPAAASSNAGYTYYATDNTTLYLSTGSSWLTTAQQGTGGPPSGAAGGALTGTYPNPGLAVHATSHRAGGTDDLLLDGGNKASTSMENINRVYAAAGSTTPTNGAAYLQFFTADKNLTISNISMATGTSGTTAQSGATLIRFGLYTIDGSNNATLVAQTASDTTLLNTNATIFTKAITLNGVGGVISSYALVAGSRYAFGFIVVGATTSPKVMGSLMPTGVSILGTKTGARQSAQADLPASIAVGSQINDGNAFWMCGT